MVCQVRQSAEAQGTQQEAPRDKQTDLNLLSCNTSQALTLYRTKHTVIQSVKAASAFIQEKTKKQKAFHRNNSHLMHVMKLWARLSHGTRVDHCNALAQQCVLLLNLLRASTMQRLTCGGESAPMNRNIKTHCSSNGGCAWHYFYLPRKFSALYALSLPIYPQH